MIFFLTNFILAISLAVDAFVVSIAIATAHKKILSKGWFVFIPLLFGGLQGFMPLIGWLLSGRFYDSIERFDHWIAFGLLSLIGANMLRNSARDDDDHPKTTLYVTTILWLGIATSIDALAVGFTLSAMSTAPLYTILFIFCVTTVLCYGAFAGVHHIPQAIANPAERFAGIVLILLGIKTVLTHLF